MRSKSLSFFAPALVRTKAIAIENKPLIFGVSKAILENFTRAFELEKRYKERGEEYPGADGEFNVKERKELKDGIKNIGSEYYDPIGPINHGHDYAGTSLHPDAKDALIEQALVYKEENLNPFLPSTHSLKSELKNARAFFKAALESKISGDVYENLAGFILHFCKGVMDAICVEICPFDEAKVSFGVESSFLEKYLDKDKVKIIITDEKSFNHIYSLLVFMKVNFKEIKDVKLPEKTLEKSKSSSRP